MGRCIAGERPRDGVRIGSATAFESRQLSPDSLHMVLIAFSIGTAVSQGHAATFMSAVRCAYCSLLLPGSMMLQTLPQRQTLEGALLIDAFILQAFVLRQA